MPDGIKEWSAEQSGASLNFFGATKKKDKNNTIATTTDTAEMLNITPLSKCMVLWLKEVNNAIALVVEARHKNANNVMR